MPRSHELSFIVRPQDSVITGPCLQCIIAKFIDGYDARFFSKKQVSHME